MDGKKYNALHFELKVLRRVRFSKIYKFLKSMILKKKFPKKHDFEEKFNFKKQIFGKNVAHQKSRFDSVYPVKCASFAFYVQF